MTAWLSSAWAYFRPAGITATRPSVIHPPPSQFRQRERGTCLDHGIRMHGEQLVIIEGFHSLIILCSNTCRRRKVKCVILFPPSDALATQLMLMSNLSVKAAWMSRFAVNAEQPVDTAIGQKRQPPLVCAAAASIRVVHPSDTLPSPVSARGSGGWTCNPQGPR